MICLKYIKKCILLYFRPWAMDPSITADLEAPKDPGAFKPHASVTDNEILGKKVLKYYLQYISVL